jgi:hypothetical protein
MNLYISLTFLIITYIITYKLCFILLNTYIYKYLYLQQVHLILQYFVIFLHILLNKCIHICKLPRV